MSGLDLALKKRQRMLVIKKSRIKGAGKGLFTTSPIRKGDVIVEYKGIKTTWDKAMRKYNNDIKAARYLFHITDKNTVDAQFTPDELARYANDAEAPIKGVKHRLKNNAHYEVIRSRPYIVAAQNIGAGSEIFVDYSGDYWEVMLEEDDDAKILKKKSHKGHKEKKTRKKKKSKQRK
jgi:SET domain-containing protein